MRHSSSSPWRRGARRHPILTVAASVALAAVAFPSLALAEDEDSSTQVYLVFDPETGDFVKSHDPNAALPPQTGLESSSASAAGGSPARGSNAMMIAAALAALAIAGGTGFAILRSRRKPA